MPKIQNQIIWQQHISPLILDLINFIVLVKEPNELANLFVPKATDGGRPIANNAGVEIKPPPPTTESYKRRDKTK